MKNTMTIKNMMIIALITLTQIGYASTETNYCALINNSKVNIQACVPNRGCAIDVIDLPQGKTLIKSCQQGATGATGHNFSSVIYAELGTIGMFDSNTPTATTAIGQQVWTLNPLNSQNVATVTQISKMYTFINKTSNPVSLQIASTLSYSNNGTTVSASNIPAQTIAPDASLSLSLNPGTDSVSVSAGKKSGKIMITAATGSSMKIVVGSDSSKAPNENSSMLIFK